ncbi:MAG: amino acid ABC transporter permease [Acidaminococcales bacterium]|jgi:polar amino acid transport system permease protein|nr:amino acid ABC transporter permease [Acidaminococcales bacterium]
MRFDYLIGIMPPLLEGFGVTLKMFFATLVLSLPLGLFLALARLSPWRVLRTLIGVYVWLLRGTPLMLQLLFFYFALPGFGITLADFPAALAAFALNYAAYFAEIFRAGIQAIDRGQYEAAKTLGMTYAQTMRHIVLPQVIRHILPPAGNEIITLVKDTSLIYVLAMGDLMRVTRSIVQRDFNTAPFGVAAAFYLGMTLILTWIFKGLEKHYSAYEK